MTRALSTIFAVLIAGLLVTSTAAAEDDDAGSTFAAGYRGFLTGGFAGLGVGYLIVRGDDGGGDDLRTLGFSAGVGALSGAGVGLALGLMDLGDPGPSRGAIIMRDALYGVGFGVLTGAAAGGLSVIQTGDGEHALLGAAIGSVAGAGLGLVVGVIDAERARARWRRQAVRIVPAMGGTRDASGQLVWVPSIAGSY